MKLEVAVTDISQCRKDITVEVPAEEVKPEFEKAYDSYTRYAKVPGFRPGRVPRSVVKQRFSKEVKEEVVSQLLPKALQQAMIENELRVIGDPAIREFSVNDGEPLKFTVGVEVLPKFELKNYKGLKVTKRVTVVTDEDVEEVIKGYRESNAEFVTVEDRPSQTGDFVSVNLVGKYIEPAEAEDLKADDVQIEIGAEGVQEEFNNALMGVNAGDVREFRVVYPSDFTSQGLAGKTLDFTANVMAVRKKEIPEADDDFAQSLGEHESIAQIRDKTREELTINAEGRADARLRDDVIAELLKDYDFELPASLLEQQAAQRVREFAQQLVQYGIPPQALKDQWDWGQEMNKARVRAERDLRAALIVAKIGEAENVSVEPAEIDEEIAEMAEAMGESPDQLKATLTKDEAISTIEDRLGYQKALDLIVDNADLTVEHITAEQEAAQRQLERANTEADTTEERVESAPEPEPELAEETQANEAHTDEALTDEAQIAEQS